MNTIAVPNILSEHADALNRAETASEFDSRDWLSSHYPLESDQLMTLTQLAQAVKLALTPKITPEAFKAELGQLLMVTSPGNGFKGKRSVHQAFLWGAAAVGLGLLMLRRFRLGQGRRHSHSMGSAI